MGEMKEDRRDPWGVVMLLLLITVLNYLDRILPGMLTEPIRKDLNLSDTAIGVINGFGFLIVYAVAGIAISRMADRGRHAVVIALSLGVWSVMTALGSLARNGWQFGFTRLGVALGEAGSLPASQAFIARSFSPERRARALSILSLGSPGGTLLALVGGGYLGGLIGWRWTFALMGLIGMVLAPIAFAVLRRHAPADAVAAEPAAEGHWTDLFRTRSGALIVAAAAMTATGAYGSIAFNPAFLMRVHHFTIAEAGVQLGIAAGVTGMIALLAGGWLSDRLARTEPRWTLGVLAAMMLLAIPILAVAYLSKSGLVATICIATGAALMNSYVPLTVVALYRLVPPHVRARTSATMLFATAVLGGMGPLLTGATSDALMARYGEDSLRYALLIVPAFSAVSGLFYALAMRFYRADIARVEAASAPA